MKVDEENQKGEADLRLRLERDGWLISSASSDRLADMEREMRFVPNAEADESYWEDYVDRGWAAIKAAQKDLRVLARADLGLDAAPRWSWRNIAARFNTARASPR